MKIFIQNRIDICTNDGIYLFSVCKGADGNWRQVNFYRANGEERIGTISMIAPDFRNQAGMNLKECPFCNGRSSTCEDCCGSGWTYEKR